MVKKIADKSPPKHAGGRPTFASKGEVALTVENKVNVRLTSEEKEKAIEIGGTVSNGIRLAINAFKLKK